MDKKEPERELVCVLFPGVVKNEEKALQCLGGIRNISQVYSQPTKKRLGLNYQPDNPFVKRIFGDMKETAGVLLKVRVKKVKSDNTVKREVVSTSVVGRVKKTYKFDSMSDFQYLPIHQEGNGPIQCALEQIIPSGLDDISFITQDAPILLTPANFQRSHKPTNYSYTDKRYKPRHLTQGTSQDTELHIRTRAERGRPNIRFLFNLIDDLPTEPNEYFIKLKDTRILTLPSLAGEFETVKKLFEERPIWSQNLIRYKTKIRCSSLKVILPCIGIYMKSGPWRMMWVRYGFDPRKEPGSRIYQTLDFRLRHQAGINSMVMTRNQILHYKKSDRVKQYPKRKSEISDATGVAEGTVIFRPGMEPTQRHIFYMYCDVQIPEVEAILSVPPPPGCLCHQARGWLPPNTDDVCRDHMFRYVKQTLLATHNEYKFEQGSSGEGSNSEDDDDGDSFTDEPSTSNI